VHVGGTTGGGVLGDLDLRVVDAGEVAGAGGLVLLGLERERVRVDTGHGATGVVVVGLDLVEVLALLLLETVLAVEDELEGVEGADNLLGELVGRLASGVERGTNRSEGDEAVGEIARVEGLDSRTISASAETLEKFQREFLLVATLAKHHTSSLTGWL
jgi:hypothetical protein